MILLKDLLSESPDQVYEPNADGIVERLVEFDEPDAYSFFIDPNSNFYIFGSSHGADRRGLYHYKMANILRDAYMNDDQNLEQDVPYSLDEFKYNLQSVTSPASDFTGDTTLDYFIGGDLNKAYKFVKKYYSKEHREWGIAGRVWLGRIIMSFWNKKEEVLSYFDKVENFFIHGLNDMPNSYRYDFIDRPEDRKLYTYEELKSGKSSENSLSDEEIKNLMAKQHLDPNAKKKLKQIASSGSGSGSEKLNKIAHAAGYRSAVEFMHDYSLAAENKILKEDPDEVRITDFDRVEWGDDNSVAFGIYKGDGKMYYDPKGTHFEILQDMIGIPENELLKSPTSWPWYFMSGRLWIRDTGTLCSFWNRDYTVRPYKRNLIQLFKDLKLNIEKALFEFIDEPENFYSFEEAFKPTMNKNKISDERVKELMKKQHLDPNAKKELQKLSSSGSGSAKLNKVAKDAGYDTAAEFMHNYSLAAECMDKELDNQKSMDLSSLIESVINQSTIGKERLAYIIKFVNYAKKFLNIEGYVPVVLVDKNEVETSTAYYNSEDKNIKVGIKGRALPDYLRSLAHELTHAKQDQLGELSPKSGNTGSKQENQANSLAGIIMRNFSQQHPEIYKMDGE